MKFLRTEIEDVIIIEPNLFSDERGYFFESFHEEKFNKAVHNTNFVQDNEAKSNYGVLRGLHFQKGEFSQAKLVRVIKGAVLDVAVDLRKDSPSFGKYIAVELTEDNRLQLFVPKGFAHGYVVLQDDTIFNYKCDNYYAPDYEAGLNWADRSLNIDWRLSKYDLIISKKDTLLPFLNDITDLF